MNAILGGGEGRTPCNALEDRKEEGSGGVPPPRSTMYKRER